MMILSGPKYSSRPEARAGLEEPRTTLVYGVAAQFQVIVVGNRERRSPVHDVHTTRTHIPHAREPALAPTITPVPPISPPPPP